MKRLPRSAFPPVPPVTDLDNLNAILAELSDLDGDALDDLTHVVHAAIADATSRDVPLDEVRHTVEWSTFLDAINPVDAARQALGMMQDPSTTAVVFFVTDDHGNRVKVDLEEHPDYQGNPMTNPTDGEGITYVEGDLYRGTHPAYQQEENP